MEAITTVRKGGELVLVLISSGDYQVFQYINNARSKAWDNRQALSRQGIKERLTCLEREQPRREGRKEREQPSGLIASLSYPVVGQPVGASGAKLHSPILCVFVFTTPC